MPFTDNPYYARALRFIEEMTYEEVATAVGVGRSTVFNHLTQAIARIHQYFKLNR